MFIVLGTSSEFGYAHGEFEGHANVEPTQQQDRK
jgi:hypothetical protein